MKHTIKTLIINNTFISLAGTATFLALWIGLDAATVSSVLTFGCITASIAAIVFSSNPVQQAFLLPIKKEIRND